MAPRAGIRSRSAPPNRSATAHTANVDEPECFPTLPGEHEDVIDAPVWLRELSTLRSGRHSRASSIVSTRTKFSTTTLDEVRSIEFTAGNQTFRISRDGSKVTDTTAPPPYSGYSWDDEDNDSNDENEDVDHNSEIHPIQGEMDGNEPDDIPTPEPLPEEATGRARGKRVRIVMPDEEDDETGRAGNGESPASANRVLTKADLYQLMWDLPFQLKRVLGLRPVLQSRPSILSTSGSDEQQGKKARPTSSQSLPDSFQLGGSEDVDFKSNDVRQGLHQFPPESSALGSPVGDMGPSADTADLRYPLTVTDLNELSALYNRVIKDLDREHRKKLHERDKEMAQLRSLLNEKDIVYRQQLRGKDFVIEDLRKRLDHSEDIMEGQIEQARHEVEDLWERRWKEREKHLLEHIRRMEATAQGKESMSPVLPSS